jgi:hypothetical protein
MESGIFKPPAIVNAPIVNPQSIVTEAIVNRQ